MQYYYILRRCAVNSPTPIYCARIRFAYKWSVYTYFEFTVYKNMYQLNARSRKSSCWFLLFSWRFHNKKKKKKKKRKERIPIVYSTHSLSLANDLHELFIRSLMLPRSYWLFLSDGPRPTYYIHVLYYVIIIFYLQATTELYVVAFEKI